MPPRQARGQPLHPIYAPEYESTLFGYSAGRANEAKYVNAGVAAGSTLATGYLQSKRISSAGLLTSSGSAYAGD